MSETIGRGVIELSADSSKLNAAINDARRSIKGLRDDASSASAKQSAGIDRYVKSLQTQAAIQGKSTREVELYKLAVRGASDEQLRAANSALKLSDAYQRGERIGANIRGGIIATGKAIAAIGAATVVAAGVGAVAFNRLVKGAGDFQDIAEKVGDTGENIASLAVAAGTAGTSMEQVSAFAIKLSKNLTGVDDEAKGTGAAIAALGLDLEKFKKLSTADQLEAIAKALKGFSDTGGGKTQILESIARGGAQLLPLLKELGNEGARQNILTDRQIALSDEYTDKQAKQRAQITLYAQAIAADALPAISDFIGGTKDLISEIAGLDKKTGDLKNSQAIRGFAEDGVIFLASLVDGAKRLAEIFVFVGKTIAATAAIASRAGSAAAESAKALISGDIKGALAARERGIAEVATIQNAANEARNAFAKGGPSLVDSVQARIAARKTDDQNARIFGGIGRPADARPQVDTSKIKGKSAAGGGGSGADKAAREAEQVRRANLADDLRKLRDLQSDERDAVAFHQRELEAIYNGGNISLAKFYDDKARIATDGVREQIQIQQRETDRLSSEIRKVKDPSEKRGLEGQRDESIRKTAKLQEEADRAGVLGKLENIAATKQLNDQISTYRANLLELQGDEAGAAKLRAAQTIEQARLLATASGGKIDVRGLEVALEQQRRVNDAKEATGLINERLAIQEDRIALAQRTGALTEIGALQAQGEARASIVGAMEKQVAELERIAAARPLDIRLQIDASRARLELDKLKADLDPLKEKFDNIFKGAGASAIENLLNRKVGILGALKQFAADASAQINGVVAKNLSEQIFGKGGILGDLGGAVGDLFKEKKDPVRIQTESVEASLSNLATQGIDPLIAAFQRLQGQVDGGIPVPGSAPGAIVPSGEKSIADLFKEPQAAGAKLSASLADTRTGAQALSDVLGPASSALAGLGREGGLAAIALRLLPSIISSIGASSAAKGLGGLFSGLFGGGSGTAGIGSSINIAENFFSLAHQGGVVGQIATQRAASPSVFAAARKYHGGGTVQGPRTEGLLANEVPIIAMGGPRGTREEVLHASDPRHADNIAPAVLQAILGAAGGDGGRAVASAIGGDGAPGGKGGDAAVQRYHDGGIVAAPAASTISQTSATPATDKPGKESVTKESRFTSLVKSLGLGDTVDNRASVSNSASRAGDSIAVNTSRAGDFFRVGDTNPASLVIRAADAVVAQGGEAGRAGAAGAAGIGGEAGAGGSGGAAGKAGVGGLGGESITVTVPSRATTTSSIIDRIRESSRISTTLAGLAGRGGEGGAAGRAGDAGAAAASASSVHNYFAAPVSTNASRTQGGNIDSRSSSSIATTILQAGAQAQTEARVGAITGEAKIADLFNGAPKLHAGGIVGQPGRSFDGVQRMHSGGLVANEVPAILMGGPPGIREEVLHARDARHADNGGKRPPAASSVNHFNIQVPQGTMRETADQIAARVALKQRRQLARGNV